jgi:hypothetical protein
MNISYYSEEKLLELEPGEARMGNKKNL